MKIIYFMDNYLVLGGAAHTILRQAELMKRAGHTVNVVIDDSGPEICKPYVKFCSERNIDIIYAPLSVSNEPEDIDILFVLEKFDYVKKLLLDMKPDILHSVQLNPVVELVARELNVPHVMNIYPAISDFFKIEYIDIFPRYHICDSEYYASVWRKHFSIQSKCIRTVADRVAANKVRIRQGNMIKCVCIGGVEKWKNQLSVIVAIHKALERGINIKLDIYGHYEKDGYGKKCVTYIQEHNLNENIELKGFSDNISECYQNSDVLICGSIRESYPNVISEGLANGNIIISTPVAGVPEVIKDRKNGYLSNGYKADDLYEKIMELNHDIQSGKVYEIIQQAIETYERVHSPESVTMTLEAYYQWLLNSFESKEQINLDCLKNKFANILTIFNASEAMFSDKVKIRNKLWYVYHVQKKIDRQIERGRHFYIWGTGKYGRSVYELVTFFFENLKVCGFIDSYKTGEYLDKPICVPDEILSDDNNIILLATVTGQTDIIEQLKIWNKKYTEDYYLLAPRYW